MKFIDLHAHSTMSDGTCTPEELVKLAKKTGLSAITVTDHDTIDGIQEAATAAEKIGIKFITGMEVSVDYKDRKLHVVALGFNPMSDKFKKLYKKIRSNKEDKIEKVIAAIREKGIDISMEKVKPFVYGKNMERYAIMRYMAAIKVSDKIQEIWDKYLNPVIEELGLNKNVTIKETAEGIHAAGGIISLAHFHKFIGLKGLTRVDQESAIADLRIQGLDGMEKYYSNYTGDDKAFAAAMIKKYKMLPTGGSDFHGANRVGVELGTGINNNLQIPYSLYENIVKFIL
ncbi:PHP domain-containing protein [Pectinatus sottacetonis]|uniref:PHP domain-containing protein n=1 Tax=Pectinatus sottacetonis TaxID=1002795 RepID=UPI0018C61E8B|nr:PHP domain-containing protein [Pectinatus sottacetonis]